MCDGMEEQDSAPQDRLTPKHLLHFLDQHQPESSRNIPTEQLATVLSSWIKEEDNLDSRDVAKLLEACRVAAVPENIDGVIGCDSGVALDEFSRGHVFRLAACLRYTSRRDVGGLWIDPVDVHEQSSCCSQVLECLQQAPVERTRADTDLLADFMSDALFDMSIPCLTPQVIQLLCEGLRAEHLDCGGNLCVQDEPARLILVLRGAAAVSEESFIDNFSTEINKFNTGAETCLPERPAQECVVPGQTLGAAVLRDGSAVWHQHAIVSTVGGMDFVVICQQQLQLAIEQMLKAATSVVRKAPSMRQAFERAQMLDLLHAMPLPTAVLLGLSQGSRAALMNTATISTVKAGDVVVHALKQYPGMMLLLSGRLSESLSRPNRVSVIKEGFFASGVTQTKSSQHGVPLLPGAVLGAESLVGHENAKGQVAAIEDAEVLVLSTQSYRSIVQQIMDKGTQSLKCMLKATDGAKNNAKLEPFVIKMLKQQLRRDSSRLVQDVLLPVLEDDATSAELCKQLSIKTYQAGETILTSGELCDTLRLVVGGAAVTHSVHKEGFFALGTVPDTAPNQKRYAKGDFMNSWPFAYLVSQTDPSLNSAKIKGVNDSAGREDRSLVRRCSVLWRQARLEALTNEAARYTGDITPIAWYPDSQNDLLNVQNARAARAHVQKKAYASACHFVVAESEVTCVELSRQSFSEVTLNAMTTRMNILHRSPGLRKPDDIHYVLSFLYSTSLKWHTLSPPCVFEICRHATLKRCRQGEIVFIKDRPIEGFLTILGGHISLTAQCDKGIALHKLSVGDAVNQCDAYIELSQVKASADRTLTVGCCLGEEAFDSVKTAWKSTGVVTSTQGACLMVIDRAVYKRAFSKATKQEEFAEERAESEILLAQYHPFVQMQQPHLREMVQHLVQKDIPYNQCVFEPGCVPGELLIIIQGEVTSSIPLVDKFTNSVVAGSKTQSLALLGPGTVLCAASVIEEKACVERYVTSSPVKFLAIPGDEFRALMLALPSVRALFMNDATARNTHRHAHAQGSVNTRTDAVHQRHRIRRHQSSTYPSSKPSPPRQSKPARVHTNRKLTGALSEKQTLDQLCLRAQGPRVSSIGHGPLPPRQKRKSRTVRQGQNRMAWLDALQSKWLPAGTAALLSCALAPGAVGGAQTSRARAPAYTGSHRMKHPMFAGMLTERPRNHSMIPTGLVRTPLEGDVTGQLHDLPPWAMTTLEEQLAREARAAACERAEEANQLWLGRRRAEMRQARESWDAAGTAALLSCAWDNGAGKVSISDGGLREDFTHKPDAPQWQDWSQSLGTLVNKRNEDGDSWHADMESPFLKDEQSPDFVIAGRAFSHSQKSSLGEPTTELVHTPSPPKCPSPGKLVRKLGVPPVLSFGSLDAALAVDAPIHLVLPTKRSARQPGLMSFTNHNRDIQYSKFVLANSLAANLS